MSPRCDSARLAAARGVNSASYESLCFLSLHEPCRRVRWSHDVGRVAIVIAITVAIDTRHGDRELRSAPGGSVASSRRCADGPSVQHRRRLHDDRWRGRLLRLALRRRHLDHDRRRLRGGSAAGQRRPVRAVPGARLHADARELPGRRISATRHGVREPLLRAAPAGRRRLSDVTGSASRLASSTSSRCR